MKNLNCVASLYQQTTLRSKENGLIRKGGKAGVKTLISYHIGGGEEETGYYYQTLKKNNWVCGGKRMLPGASGAAEKNCIQLATCWGDKNKKRLASPFSIRERSSKAKGGGGVGLPRRTKEKVKGKPR